MADETCVLTDIHGKEWEADAGVARLALTLVGRKHEGGFIEVKFGDDPRGARVSAEHIVSIKPKAPAVKPRSVSV